MKMMPSECFKRDSDEAWIWMVEKKCLFKVIISYVRKIKRSICSYRSPEMFDENLEKHCESVHNKL